MKLTLSNENYCATIVKLNTLLTLQGLDNLVGVPLYGFQALVKKGTETGTLGVLFTTETQLSEDFCRENNLFTDPELNKDKIKGYISEKRRVRTIKLRGHISSALLLELSSLSYLGIDISKLKEGDMFNEIDGVEICRKYEIQSKVRKNNKPQKEKKKYINRLFPEHIDTSFLDRNLDKIEDKEYLYITQKLHGTSFRLGNQLVYHMPKWVNKFWWTPLYSYLKDKFTTKRYELIAGSRRVIKNEENSDKSFYEKDVWNQTLEKIGHLIPKSWVVYGELVGWAGDKPIQKNYTYQVPSGEFDIYIYRISIINEDGYQIDLDYRQLIKWCEQNGLKYCPLLWEGFKVETKEGHFDEYLDIKYYEYFDQAVPLDSNSAVDEGICVHVAGIQPKIFKHKSPKFYEHETKMLDQEIVDIESEES